LPNPAGTFPDSEYEMKRIQLAPGDSVIFLSDGLTDAMNASGEILGIERVVEMLRGYEKKSPQEILQALFPA